MENKSEPQEWSLHAQLTISHGGTGAPTTVGTHPTISSFTSSNSGGVRLEYSFKTHGLPPNNNLNIPEKSSTSGGGGGYGFQRGNILFTTRPPQNTRSHSFNCSSSTSSSLGRPRDSGYNSEQHCYGSLPSRGTKSPQPYNRRCMSTYTIVLADTRPSPVLESYEESSLPAITKSIILKDAASQTLQDEDVTTSKTVTVPQPKMGSKIYNTRRKTDSSYLLQVPTLQLPDQDEQQNSKPSRRLTRSPARLGGKSPLLQKRIPATRDSSTSSSSTSQTTSSEKKTRGRPRTVHIDVYCTGSEEDNLLESSLSSSSNTTTPQTVYESDKLRVVHSRPKKNELPHALSRKSESFKFSTIEKDVEERGYDSDDTLSSLYPSRSSFESVDISLPPTSRDTSWSTIASSSCVLFDDDSSSWKDTTDPELSSLAQSDSFEYADSLDRYRIQEKEEAWARLHSGTLVDKSWKSPESQRRQLIQQQKFKEFLAKHLNKSKQDDNWEIISSSEDGSHFGLTREDTIRRVTLSSSTDPSIMLSTSIDSFSSDTLATTPRSHVRDSVGPFGKRPPSPPPPKLHSSFTSPSQGYTTSQLAEKFGPIVSSLRKPGNHSGPSKNPECSCEHCRRFYEELTFRTRACSLGDVPVGSWRDTMGQVSSRNSNSLPRNT